MDVAAWNNPKVCMGHVHGGGGGGVLVPRMQDLTLAS